MIAAIGAAFALSFDTISHALLFSLTGATMAGWMFAGALGVLFTAGMALTDTLNGLWVVRIAASRFVSVAIAVLCLLLAAVGLARISAAPGAVISVMTVVILLATYLVGRRHGTKPQ
jgi:high-affinity nickel-transport protein